LGNCKHFFGKSQFFENKAGFVWATNGYSHRA